MKIKPRLLLLAALALVACMLLAPLSGQAAEFAPVRYKVHTHVAPPPSAQGTCLMWFLEEVTKRTNGAVTFQVFWSSSLAKPAGQLELVEKNTVQIALTSMLYFPSRFIIGHFEYSFPFGPVDPILVTKAKRQIFDEFPAKREEYTKNGVIMLANVVCPYYDLQSKKPIRNLADLKGMKIGMTGRYFGEWMKPVGVMPVVIPGADTYMGLQNGVIDASLLWLDFSYAISLYEQAKYRVMIDFGSAVAEEIVMNLDTFTKLDPALQEIFLQVGREAEMQRAQYLKDRQEVIYKSFNEKGVELIQFPREDQEKWAAMLPDTAKQWADEAEAAGLPGYAIAKRWQEITTEMGHKWPRQWAVK